MEAKISGSAVLRETESYNSPQIELMNHNVGSDPTVTGVSFSFIYVVSSG